MRGRLPGGSPQNGLRIPLRGAGSLSINRVVSGWEHRRWVDDQLAALVYGENTPREAAPYLMASQLLSVCLSWCTDTRVIMP